MPVRKSILLTLLILSVSNIIISGCGQRIVESTWRDREIIIDGADLDGEWEGARYFIEEKKIIIGIMNDEENIYLRLSSVDQKIPMQILMAGLTVWFDPKGGKKKTFGVHFPVGIKKPEEMMMKSQGQSQLDGAGDDRRNKLIQAANSVVEFHAGKKKKSIAITQEDARANGVECRIASTKSNIVYEIKVPLKHNPKTGLGISKTAIDKLGVGFESDKMRRLQRPRGNRSGGRGDGMSGGMMGGGGRSGRRGGMSGEMPSSSGMPDQIELWLKVLLAEPAL